MALSFYLAACLLIGAAFGSPVEEKRSTVQLSPAQADEAKEIVGNIFASLSQKVKASEGDSRRSVPKPVSVELNGLTDVSGDEVVSYLKNIAEEINNSGDEVSVERRQFTLGGGQDPFGRWGATAGYKGKNWGVTGSFQQGGGWSVGLTIGG